MAHLNGGRDRGQLLLVAVLVLAAAFIVLALVINSAIFTENLATREDVAGSEEALEYRADVTASIDAAIVAGNEDRELATEAELEAHARNEISTLQNRGGLTQAIRGGVVDLSYDTKQMGDRIAQDNASRNLTDDNASANWRPATGVDQIRNVGFELTEVDTQDLGSNEPFRFRLESGDDWQLSVSNESLIGSMGSIDDDEVAVTIETGTGNQAECVRDSPNTTSPLTIDVTGASVNGEPCHALHRLSNGTQMWLGTGVSSPFDIEFENADNVNGTYSMVTSGGTPDTGIESGYDSDEPYVVNALYGVELSYAYQNHAVAYEDTIRVAPGETPPPLPPGASYEPDEDCEWVDQETNNGTDPIKIDDQVVDCDVVTDEVVEVLNSGVVLGDVESHDKTLDMDDSEIYGNATTQRVADIQNGTVTGDVTSTNKNVKIADDTAVGGAVTGGEQVEVKGESLVEGNVESETKEVKILGDSTVEGSVTAGDFVKVEDVTVEGHVYIDESDFDCTNSVINGQDCGSYTPKDPGDWPP